MKRVISFVLALVLVCTLLPTIVFKAEATQSRTGYFVKDYTLTGDGASDMVAIALAQVGRTGSQMGYSENWCANFVGDCAKLAKQAAAVPHNGSVAGWTDENGKFYNGLYQLLLAANATVVSTPKKGDICFYDWNVNGSANHVEIVYKVSENKVYTVGGNTGNGTVYTTKVGTSVYSVNNSMIWKYVRPNYINIDVDCGLSFNTNGGSAISSITTTAGTAVTIPSTVPEKFGYNFQGWATSATGSATYQPGGTITISQDTTLYAVWSKDSHSVSASLGGCATIKYPGVGRYFSFTVDKDATYEIKGLTGSEGYVDSVAWLYDSEGYGIATDDDSGGNGQFKIEAELEAGEEYILYMKAYDSSFTGWFNWRISALEEQVVGTTIYDECVGTATISESGSMDYYLFTPTVSDTYVIYSFGDTDSMVYLYDSNGTQIASDDQGGDGNNFRLTYYMTAGTTYQFGIKLFDSSATGVVDFAFGKVYNLTYDANGGSNAPASQECDFGRALSLSNTAPTRDDYMFLGWAGSADASYVMWQPGQSINIGADTTLYAVWQPYITGSGQAVISTPGSTVCYTFTAPNDRTYVIYSTSDLDSRVYLYDSDWVLLASDDDGGDGNNFRLQYDMTAGETYYFEIALYDSSATGTVDYMFGRTYKVSYDANGGMMAPSAQYRDYGSILVLTSIATPFREGYTFLGWAAEADATSAEYQPGEEFTCIADTTLYAVWKVDDEEDNTTDDTSNICGDNITWTLDDAGTLTVSGTGPMYNYETVGPGGSTSPFYSNSNIKKIVIENGITTIGDYVFKGCPELREITIPNSVLTIGNSAFDLCSNLMSVTIPDSVAIIDIAAFNRCSSLKEVWIPISVSCIDYGAFGTCKNLSDVYYSGSQAQWNEIVIDSTNLSLLSATIHFVDHTHSFTDYKSNNDATYDADGTKTAKCDRCEETDTVTDPGSKKIRTGWHQIGGKWYYFDANGVMATNTWKKDSNGWCWLTASGAMATNQWVKDSKGWCYVGANGYCWTNRWAKDSIGWIWLDSEGSMTKSQWIQDGGKWYYLDSNGYMVSNQWRKDSNGWCWLTASGAMATNQWVKDSKGWCYVGANGYCWTNRWAKDSIGWIWLDSQGSMTKSQWIKDGNNWYYLNASGYMVTGRVTIGGIIYNFASNGVWIP